MAITTFDIEPELKALLAGIRTIEAHRAVREPDWGRGRELILEYLGWARTASGIEPFAAQPWLRDELERLEDWYTPPRGALILATVDQAPAGVVAVSTHAEGWAELKRLYVRPAARGLHLGERLVWAAIAAAREFGCHTLRLETLPGLTDHAIAIYRRLGFHSTERFDETAVEGLLYLERPVASRSDSSHTP